MVRDKSTAGIPGERMEQNLEDLDEVEALASPPGFGSRDKDDLLRRKRTNEHLLEGAKDGREKARILTEIGDIHFLLSEYEQSVDHYEQHLAIAREIGDRWGEANACWNLGLAYEREGDLERAADLMQVCIDFERQIGHPDAEKDADYLENVRARLGKNE